MRVHYKGGDRRKTSSQLRKRWMYERHGVIVTNALVRIDRGPGSEGFLSDDLIKIPDRGAETTGGYGAILHGERRNFPSTSHTPALGPCVSRIPHPAPDFDLGDEGWDLSALRRYMYTRGRGATEGARMGRDCPSSDRHGLIL